MAINTDMQDLISAIVNGNEKKIEILIKNILDKDKAEKNAKWRTAMLEKITENETKKLELPYNIQNMCQVFYPDSFQAKFFYITKEMQIIVQKIVARKKVCEKIADLGLDAKNTTLLYGEPGVGKTLLAKYIAYQLDKPLLLVRFSTIINSHMGSTAANMHNILNFVKNHDVILMLDEIDTVTRKRSGESGSNGEIGRITVSIMQELDELKTGKILIAATNRPDVIDPALMRRFVLKNELKRMGTEDRIEQQKKFWSAVNMDAPYDLFQKATEDLTPAELGLYMEEQLIEILEKESEENF